MRGENLKSFGSFVCFLTLNSILEETPTQWVDAMWEAGRLGASLVHFENCRQGSPAIPPWTFLTSSDLEAKQSRVWLVLGWKKSRQGCCLVVLLIAIHVVLAGRHFF